MTKPFKTILALACGIIWLSSVAPAYGQTIIGFSSPQIELWQFSPANTISPSLSTWGLRVPSLANCNTIDTDADGDFSCGTDEGGAGASFAFPFTAVAGGNATSTLLYLYTGLYSLGSTTIQYASTTAITAASANIARLDNLTSAGFVKSSATGVLSVDTATYESGLTAGDAITRTGNDFDFDGGATPSGDLSGTWASPSVTDDSHAHTGTTLSGIDISSDTNLTAGTNITLTDDDLSVDDVFILNTGDVGTGSYTFPNASTTNFSTTYASSTQYFGANLVDCDDPAASKLLWSDTGRFSCGTDQSAAGDGAFPFTPVAGGNATSTLLYLYNGLYTIGSTTIQYASTTAITAASANIARLDNLTSAGFVKSSATGVLSVDTTAYGTGSVTSVATNNGITGGTINTTGTIGLDLSALGGLSSMPLTLNGSNQLTATGTVSLSAPYFIATSTTATSTLAGSLQFGSTVGDNLTIWNCNRDYPASNSIGGCLSVRNTNNAAAGLMMYTNHGSGATAPLLQTRVDNVAFDFPGWRLDYDGANDGLTIAATAAASNAASLSNTGVDHTLNVAYTGSTADKGAANFTSTNVLGSVFQATGGPDDLGLAKYNFNLLGTAASSILSLDASANYDGQGLFMDCTGGSCDPTNKSLNIADDVGTNGMGLTLLWNGKLGLGTTSPYARLSVVGETVSAYFTATTTRASTFPYASTTMVTATTASTTNLVVSGLTSALVQTGTDGTTAEYAGTSCTNQFARSLSALGVATCATVGATDVSLANLTATDSTLTFSGTYNGSTARTIGLNLGNANTWTALQQFANASTSLLSSNGTQLFTDLRIPTSTDPSITAAGDTAINTTVASSSIEFHDGTEATAVYSIIPRSFTISTSTLGAKYLIGATTTQRIGFAGQKQRLDRLMCISSGATLQLEFGDGTNFTATNMITTSTTTVTSFANNTWEAYEPVWIRLRPQTSWTETTCTYFMKSI